MRYSLSGGEEGAPPELADASIFLRGHRADGVASGPAGRAGHDGQHLAKPARGDAGTMHGLDVAGEAKAKLGVEDLLAEFKRRRGVDIDEDALLLG